MFETLEETSRSDLGKRILTLLVSIVLHVVAIIVIVIMPLVFFNVLPEQELLTFLIAPNRFGATLPRRYIKIGTPARP